MRKIDLSEFQGEYTIGEAKGLVKDIKAKIANAHGVSFGDRFKNGNYIVCEVVDILECKSLVTGETVKHICLAKGIEGSLSTNVFEVPFSTVVRNKII